MSLSCVLEYLAYVAIGVNAILSAIVGLFTIFFLAQTCPDTGSMHWFSILYMVSAGLIGIGICCAAYYNISCLIHELTHRR